MLVLVVVLVGRFIGVVDTMSSPLNVVYVVIRHFCIGCFYNMQLSSFVSEL